MSIDTLLVSEVDASPAIARLNKDVKRAAALLSPTEARHLVNLYYTWQAQRIRTNNQIRSLSTSGEPSSSIAWVSSCAEQLENRVRSLLDVFSTSTPLGEWSRSICGIGPVLCAGLLAHIDIAKAPTVGHIYSFAGLNPTARWNKGEKRPWNADLKVLCYKIGESFVKVKGRDSDFYGAVYDERKAYESAKNDAGDYATRAADFLDRYKIGKTTLAYSHYIEGRLPPAHLHGSARRYAVKLFLSHYHHVGYTYLHGSPPDRPYALAMLENHTHMIDPPNFPTPLVESPLAHE